MKRRTTIGLLAVVTGGLLAGASALAFGHGGRPGHLGMMKRFVSAAIDDALDQAQVTPEQRTAIHGARDRAFAAFAEHRKSRGAHLEEALALFESDQVDRDRVEAFRRQREEEHRQVTDAISQALIEVHDILTPAQRKTVADYVRSHHRHRS